MVKKSGRKKEREENKNRTKEIEKTDEGERCEEMEGKKRVKKAWRMGGQGRKRGQKWRTEKGREREVRREKIGLTE